MRRCARGELDEALAHPLGAGAEAVARAEATSAAGAAEPRRPETHADAQMKAQEMSALKDAFGIGDGHVRGQAFDRELQERKKAERQAERGARGAARRGRGDPRARAGEGGAAAREEKRREEKAERRRRRRRSVRGAATDVEFYCGTGNTPKDTQRYGSPPLPRSKSTATLPLRVHAMSE